MTKGMDQGYLNKITWREQYTNIGSLCCHVAAISLEVKACNALIYDKLTIHE
jgi:hypothetical protein